MKNRTGTRALILNVNKKILPKSRRSQVTIFIIIAVILVAVVGLYFVSQGVIQRGGIPSGFAPVYNQFLTCVEENVLAGIGALESQAGYIYLPEFESGSSYMPFSSQLEFAGNPVPYWYYVSGNNVPKEQVISKSDMGNQLEQFIENEISDCDFSAYYNEGFSIEMGEPRSTISIKNSEVDVSLDMNLIIEKNDETHIVRNSKVSVSSNLGLLYDNAKNIYDNEQQDLFLEEYAVDTLRLYAPVDGVEITCSPLTWNADTVFNELGDAIEQNTLSLKVKGGDYVLNDKDNEYFVKDFNIGDVNVRFLNSQNWPHAFEVSPTDGSFLISEPIGNQQGLGVLGFCYIPYHFVYDVKYPVMVQVEKDGEIFQFPVAVVLKGNNPRESLDANAIGLQNVGLCENKNTPVQVKTYDSGLNPVSSQISYECFGQKCEIGESPLNENFPQCANGYIIVRASGYEETRYLFSTISGGSVEIILDKIYGLSVDLNLDGVNYNNNAIINFVSENGKSKSIVYPEQRTVELSEGQYEIQVYIYRDSSIDIGSSVSEQCIEVPRSGFGGLIGLKEEKCFDVEFPEQIISNSLAGGGKIEYYILESELRNSGTVEINAQSLPVPNTLEQLQNNYVSFEEKGVQVFFR